MNAKVYPVYIAHVQAVLKRALTSDECERAEALRNDGKSIEEIADAIEPPPSIEKIDLPGRKDWPMNIWGRATLLLSLLYRTGSIPTELHIHAVIADDVDPGMYHIDGEPIGRTEEEVTTNIWKMVARYAEHGYLFEA